MTGFELRKAFTGFFAARDHRVVPSASVVPWDDPSLLFTNAGMNQFKDVFLGRNTREYKRAVDFQKCIRAGGKHNDLDDVGRSPIHQTFFEMLGNWSFGDYYKEEAIVWAWELLTEEWKLQADKLWITVFREDDETEQLWQQHTDVAADRILRFDEKENFWEMGESGPCGPNSEINYDTGPDNCERKNDSDHICEVNGDCSRYKEIWNLVFIQYNREIGGDLTPLPAHHVDTGMGFERMLSILQNVNSNYDTDIFQPLMNHIGELTVHPYKEGETAVAYRVIADHLRALSFAISDGALPSNEGRGYVLRRILRRAARYGRTLGMVEPFLYKLVPTLSEQMGSVYPELRLAREKVKTILRSEEEAFGRTLDHGLELFEEIVSQASTAKRSEIHGNEAFKLYDTFGFPLDLTRLMAEERGLSVDLTGFAVEMEQQRSRSGLGGQGMKNVSDRAMIRSDLKAIGPTKFLGYETHYIDQTKVLNCDNGAIALAETPFYGESGGQVGDTGWIETDSGDRVAVLDTTREGDVIIHHCDPDNTSDLALGMMVGAYVDKTRRKSIARNHTATHLLHAVLRETLGAHVEQRGSEVSPNRLRFDFAHFTAIDPETLDIIEHKVNKLILQDIDVECFITELEDARNRGAIAIFTEKYDDRVRVVRIGAVSMELCGGTHLDHTGEIGMFRLIRESGVAAGERRIEAITGISTYEAVKRDEMLITKIAKSLKCSPDDLVKKVGDMKIRVRELERHIRNLGLDTTRNWVEELVNDAVDVEGVSVTAARVECPDIDTLRTMADALRDRQNSAAVGILFAIFDDRPACIVVATKSAIADHGLHAGKLAREVAAVIGGGGGGKAHMAQGGGNDASRIDEALEQATIFVEKALRDK